MRRAVMLLLFGSARALLRGAVPGRLARRAASTAAEELEPVKVTIDQRLRDALRLPGKQRRPRCLPGRRNAVSYTHLTLPTKA